MGLDVDPEGIRKNAKSLREIADTFGSIGAEGANTDLGWDVFGVLGRPFAWGLGFVAKAAGNGVGAYGAIVGHTAEQLDKAAQTIDHHDEEAAARLAQ